MADFNETVSKIAEKSSQIIAKLYTEKLYPASSRSFMVQWLLAQGWRSF